MTMRVRIFSGFSVGWLASVALAAPIAVTNQGFESPVQGPNGFTTQSAPGTTPGWTILSTGQGGVFYPTVSSWNYAAPYGNQVLYCNGATYEQTLGVIIAPSRTYTLRVSVVNRPNYFNNFYTIKLVAGTTVVAQNLGNVTPPIGGATDAVIAYSSPASGPTIGQPIRIRLYGLTQANFDNVRLEDNAPAACPGDVNGDGKTNTADFNILATNFATGSGKTRAQGDLSGDGFVNTADFNILAGDFGCLG